MKSIRLWCALVLAAWLSAFGFSAGSIHASSTRRADGAELVFALTAPASAQNPSFSSDSQTILFTLFHQGYNDGAAGLYRISSNNPSPVRLLDEPEYSSVNLPGSSWNPATKRIVFTSDREGANEIWTMAADASDLTRVTAHNTNTVFVEPSFSPDGQWIVFEMDTNVSDEEQPGSIWKVRGDGTGLTELTNSTRAGTDDRQPNWSPSGDRIVFQRRVLGSDEWYLYTMKSDGTELRQLTFGGDDTDASWSADGKWIVYSSAFGNLPTANIFVISADGSTSIRVTRDGTHNDGAPSWSHDGRWIVFESFATEDETNPASLWRIAAPPLLCQTNGK